MHWIDPDSLPEIHGRFERFLINPHGEPDGLILADGREVHFPPHMAGEIAPALAKGAQVKIRGVRPREGDVFAAVSLQADGGERIEDRGPPDKHDKPKKPHAEREERTLSGRVKRALHGPKGERRGMLLESGEIVRFPPHAAEDAQAFLKPGAKVCVRGKGLKTKFGEVIEAKAIGADEDSLHPLKEPKKPKPPHREPKPHHPSH
jgi:hypothetical protein